MPKEIFREEKELAEKIKKRLKDSLPDLLKLRVSVGKKVSKASERAMELEEWEKEYIEASIKEIKAFLELERRENMIRRYKSLIGDIGKYIYIYIYI